MACRLGSSILWHHGSEEIQEGNILIYQDNEYYINREYEATRRETLEEKLERLKALREEDTEE